jgi:hypothetical protein
MERYYEIQMYTGERHGWEAVGGEPNKEAAERCIQLYHDNQPGYPMRMVVKKSKEPGFWGSNADKYYENMGTDGYKLNPWLL